MVIIFFSIFFVKQFLCIKSLGIFHKIYDNCIKMLHIIYITRRWTKYKKSHLSLHVHVQCVNCHIQFIYIVTVDIYKTRFSLKYFVNHTLTTNFFYLLIYFLLIITIPTNLIKIRYFNQIAIPTYMFT